jgi:hypothetical protein
VFKTHEIAIHHFAIVLPLLLIYSSESIAQGRGEREPIPDEASLKAASDELHKTYGAEYSKCKTISQKSDFAKKMISASKMNNKLSAKTFVLLRIARETAAEAGNSYVAIDACEEMSRLYQIDDLTMKKNIVVKMVKSAQSPTQYKSAALIAFGISREAIAGNQYDIAEKLVDLSVSMSDKSEDPMTKELTRWNRDSVFQKTAVLIMDTYNKTDSSSTDRSKTRSGHEGDPLHLIPNESIKYETVESAPQTRSVVLELGGVICARAEYWLITPQGASEKYKIQPNGGYRLSMIVGTGTRRPNFIWVEQPYEVLDAKSKVIFRYP